MSAGGRRLEQGPKVVPPPESYRPTITGTRYVVSAGHHLAAEAAARVLDCGGNAIDAGVAGGLVLNVVQPDMCNFGGVAPILVRAAGSDEVWSVAGLGGWGREATLDAFKARYGDELPDGPGNAVVPGAPDAWLTALERWGTRSFAEVAGPAIELAEGGFALDPRAALSISLHARDWDTTRAVYRPGGRDLQPGDVLRQPELAALLRRLADAGGADAARRAFYEGEVAQRLVEFNRAGGGWLTTDDLAEFRAEVAPAVSRPYGGWLVHTPDTWCQGPALLQTLAILDGFDLPALGHNTAAYLHVLAESVKLAFSDRERWYGDPRFVDVPLDRLLSDEHAAELRARIVETALPNLPTLREPPLRRSDTTYLCVVDGDGNAFSATPSDTLEEGPIVPGLGIMVSPRGVQSRLDPAHPSVLAPGKRPRLTPSPAIALHEDARVWAFGSPGRRRDPAGDAAGVPERRRVRHDAAAGSRGAARRELQLPQLVLSAHRAGGTAEGRGANPGGRAPRPGRAWPRRGRVAGAGVRGRLGFRGARPPSAEPSGASAGGGRRPAAQCIRDREVGAGSFRRRPVVSAGG